jgi:antitoxin component YwqK of YwqJK toxin-antitoxin module
MTQSAETPDGTAEADNYIGVFERLVDDYQSEMIDFCDGLVGEQVVAQQIAQDVFLTTYAAIADLRTSTAKRSWLYVTAREQCIHSVRARQPHLLDDDSADSKEAEVKTPADFKEAVMAGTAELPKPQGSAKRRFRIWLVVSPWWLPMSVGCFVAFAIVLTFAWGAGMFDPKPVTAPTPSQQIAKDKKDSATVHGLDGNVKNRKQGKDGQRSGACQTGTENGPCTTKFPNGKNRTLGNYKKGVRHGGWTEWHESGSLAARGNYIDGKQDGEWRHFGSSGTLAEIGHWKMGSKSDTWTTFHANGKEKTITPWKDGKQSGRYRELSETGGVVVVGSFVDGHKSHHWMARYKNGKQKSQGHYRQGKMDGKWTEWAEGGKLESVTCYQAGEVQWTETELAAAANRKCPDPK